MPAPVLGLQAAGSDPPEDAQKHCDLPAARIRR